MHGKRLYFLKDESSHPFLRKLRYNKFLRHPEQSEGSPEKEKIFMSIDTTTLQKVAHLARLGIDAKEASSYQEKLVQILQWIEQLQSIDTTGVEPMAHPFALQQPLRPDAISETDEHSKFQKLAPQAAAGLYLVPKVIE